MFTATDTQIARQVTDTNTDTGTGTGTDTDAGPDKHRLYGKEEEVPAGLFLTTVSITG